jgi:hypothetical protein
MKFFYLPIILALVFIPASASQSRKVLLIGIDGCRSDALQQANTPNIDGLLSGALYSYDSWHTGITFSGPSWSTVLTGVQWNKHGVSNNLFTVSNFNNFPAFPKRAKELQPNLKCVEVVEWHPLADDFYNDGWDKKIKVTDGSTSITADSAIAQLQDPDIDVLFAYFDKVDLTGHSSTFSPANSQYMNAIEEVDGAVGMILNALYARPTYANEDWLILLVTDHGGISFFHGGNSNEERHIWWIASGNAVAYQQVNEADPGTYNCQLINTFDSTCVDLNLLKQSPTHPDIAVTAIHHLIFDTGVNPETKQEWSLDGKSWLTLPRGLGEEQLAGIRIQPNPASTNVSVIFGQPLAASVTLADMQGQILTHQTVVDNEMHLSLENIAAGMYFLKIHTGEKTVVKKITVLK